MKKTLTQIGKEIQLRIQSQGVTSITSHSSMNDLGKGMDAVDVLMFSVPLNEGDNQQAGCTH